MSSAKAALMVLLAASPLTGAAGDTEIRVPTRIWDTVSPLGTEADISNRTDWKLVPHNLISLEANPVAAAADPGQ